MLVYMYLKTSLALSTVFYVIFNTQLAVCVINVATCCRQDALSRGQTPDASARRVDALTQDVRRLQQQQLDERRAVETLRGERVTLETDVHELRQRKTSQQRKLRDLDRRLDDTEQAMSERIARAERLVAESATRRAHFEQMSDMRSLTPGRASADFRRSPSPGGGGAARRADSAASRLGGGYKSASVGDLLDIDETYGTLPPHDDALPSISLLTLLPHPVDFDPDAVTTAMLQLFYYCEAIKFTERVS